MEIEYINITLTWQDEPAQYPGGTNLPDEFKVELLDIDGSVLVEDKGENGDLELSWQGVEGVEYTGNFIVVVTLEYAGDQEPRFSISDRRSQPDNSNEYSLEIEYTRFTKKYIEIEGGDIRLE